MGKGRAPCCDKNKVKRGPWSPEEDLKLITFIQKHGHQNWRSLPKQAGLVRCGKSCRLRWINYLRPDVKRGHFTKEEEETIIKLHEALGNKWSKIASHLPGRTDNEIKNVWNTHLKKKLFNKTSDHSDESKHESSSITSSSSSSSSSDENQALTPLMAQKTNNSNEQNSDNHQVSDIKDFSPTSFYSIESATPILQDDQELITPVSPLFNCMFVNEVVDKPVKSSSSSVGLLEIPFEADYDFWNMLDDDNIGGSFVSNDQVHEDAETRKWIIELEKELGLEPQAFIDHLEKTTTTTKEPHIDIWPSWLDNSGF